MVDCTRASCLFLRYIVLAVSLMAVSKVFARVAVPDTIYDTNGMAVIKRVSSVVVDRYPYGVTFLREEQLDSTLNFVDTELVPIVFKRDKTDFILPNAPLDSMVKVVNRVFNDKDVRLAYVWIGGSASPEGPEAHNVWLGKIRAKRLHDYLKEHTLLPDSLIRIDNLMEDWRTPLKIIRQKEFAHKDRVLEIWRNQPDNCKRKREIKAIDNGVTWEYLIDKTFRPARNARMAIVCVVEDSIVAYYPNFNPKRLAVDVPPIDSFKPIRLVDPEYRYQFIALKTNLAVLGLLVANCGVEFSFGRGFSLDLPFYYSPYDITSKFRVRVLGTQPELRYWFRSDQPGDGHFFGNNGAVAGFNVSFPHTDRFQDPERALWGLGLSYGYGFNFGVGKHWGLEFNIGAGYMNYHLDTFDNVYNGKLMNTKRKDYWGITRVGISLTYRFWHRKLIGFKEHVKEDGL